MHIGISEQTDINERAQKAVAAFRKMQFSLTSYAQSITGDRRVRVEVGGAVPYTDGKTIYYRPPIALGDKTPHDRNLCDSRGDDGLQSCPACRVREEVLVNIYHEIAHIAFGSFDGNNYFQNASFRNPFLAFLFNSVEDSRVDGAMFKARKGTRKMLEADTFNLLGNGVPDGLGNMNQSIDSPLNSQISLACYMEAAGYEGWQKFFHPKIEKDISDSRVQEILDFIRDAKTVKDVWDNTEPLFERLQDLGYFLPEPEEQDEESKPNQEPDGEPDSGEGEGDDQESESNDPGPDQDSPSPKAPEEGSSEDEDSSSGTGDSVEGGSESSSGVSDEAESSGDVGPESEDDTSAEEGEGDGSGDQNSGEVSKGSKPDQEEEGVENEQEGGGSRGDQEDGSGFSSGNPSDEQEGGERGEPDNSEDTEGEGDNSGSNLSGDERATESDTSPEGEDDNGSERGDEGHDRPETESEGEDSNLLESGADEGLGGQRVEYTPQYGSSDDVAAALEYSHSESIKSGDANKETSAEQSAVTVAVVQGTYFETPSANVSEVKEHKYSPHSRGWDSRRIQVRGDLRKFGVVCDMEISESHLGPALLKTRRVFSDNQNASYQPNMRSGRVNSKVLGRRAWNDDDRLFGKKKIASKKDYAVMIGMDISSSNLGSNLALLKRSVKAQAELCHRMGIKFSIVAHSAHIVRSPEEASYGMDIHHVKSWDEPWTDEVENRLATLVGVGGNLDGHAMEYLRKSFKKVSVTDKILLYYTDGKMPAANADEELVLLQRQIKLCKRDQITLLGVGMRTDSPARHGLDTVQVNGDSDIKIVVEHLGKRLHGSAR